MNSPLRQVVDAQKSGRPIGIYAVCSAHPLVLEAAMIQAVADGTPVLIEATSNQVDQFGGYTGMVPQQFREACLELAERVGLPATSIVLGGDHLGPNSWQGLPADEAMSRAVDLVVAYAEAGYDKIHLDCSMRCADDPETLSDELVAARAARLLGAAEEASARAGRPGSVHYVVGTEVPTPGGAHEELEGLAPTEPAAARHTIAAHRKAFEEAGLGACWDRVMALVVQPAVEFDHLKVVAYDRERTHDLKRILDDEPRMVFEAHSTDYQTAGALADLVEDRWAVLKVGPGLTFALREALFALEHIEAELIAPGSRSNLRETVEAVMLADPSYWQGYYGGSADEQALARVYSYSDRMRYYWPKEAIDEAVQRLIANLSAVAIPLPLLSQYLPGQYERVLAGELAADPRALVIDRVRDVLRPYAAACWSRS